MERIWAVARQTLAEALRMRIALVFLFLLALIVLGLPLSVSGDNSLAGAVQSYLSYSMMAISLFLGILTIFMSRSLSDEISQRQVLILMTKPLPRWQYVLGKWTGITLLNGSILLISGVAIYAMVQVVRFLNAPADDTVLSRISVLLAAVSVVCLFSVLARMLRRVSVPTAMVVVMLSLGYMAVLIGLHFVPGGLRTSWAYVGLAGLGVLLLLWPYTWACRNAVTGNLRSVLVVWTVAVLCHLGLQVVLGPLSDGDRSASAADLRELDSEVLVARAARPFHVPRDAFESSAKLELEREIEQGNVLDKKQKLRDLIARREAYWRVVGPLDMRDFTFDQVLVNRSPENTIQIRYKTEVTNYPPDEVFKAVWVFGDSRKGTAIYRRAVKHVVGRYHTVSAPADCVAADNTLSVRFFNEDPYNDAQWPSVIEFQGRDGVEVLFLVGSFAGNFVRLLVMVWFRLFFLAALALMMATVFSFPVACLASFTVYILVATRGFMAEAFDWVVKADVKTFESVENLLATGTFYLYSAITFFLPDFTQYNAIEDFVGGRNVSLVWVLNALINPHPQLAGIPTFPAVLVLVLAMLLFHRREVAEVSV